jgi:hypothetical protein
MRQIQNVLTRASGREPMRVAATDVGGHRGRKAYAIGPRSTLRTTLMVHENPTSYFLYESEGSEHRSLGSISIEAGARWTATLTVPIPPRSIAFLQLERRGDLPAGYLGAEESALLSLPIGETEAVIALLTGVVAQARRDGVLPGA